MAQASGIALADMPLRRKLLEKIERDRDVHSELRGPLKRAVTAVVAAHEEDKDDLELAAPSMASFEGLLRFLGQSYRTDLWPSPAIALTPGGHFLAIWDIGPNRLSVEFVEANAAKWVAVLRELDGVRVLKGEYAALDAFEEPPFPIPSRKAMA
ncbi:MAG: hypothetical protein JO267_06945 [Alphaproteobacteria bacterium]|nr:hypothetical protein [Alphaproteobacteria bacterium]